MPVSIDALDSALLLMDNWEHNRRTELKPSHWLHILSPRSWPGDPLYPSWTWQVVAGEAGQLMLRADGLAEQLVLTQDLADDLIIFTPSKRVFLADYLEVLSWYRACRWGPCLLDNLDQGDITVTADRYASRLNTRAIAPLFSRTVKAFTVTPVAPANRNRLQRFSPGFPNSLRSCSKRWPINCALMLRVSTSVAVTKKGGAEFGRA